MWDTWWQISFPFLYVEKDMRMLMKLQVLQNVIQLQWKKSWLMNLGFNVYCCCSLKLDIPNFYNYFSVHVIEEINKYSQRHRKRSKFTFKQYILSPSNLQYLIDSFVCLKNFSQYQLENPYIKMYCQMFSLSIKIQWI